MCGFCWLFLLFSSFNENFVFKFPLHLLPFLVLFYLDGKERLEFVLIYLSDVQNVK